MSNLILRSQCICDACQSGDQQGKGRLAMVFNPGLPIHEKGHCAYCLARIGPVHELAVAGPVHALLEQLLQQCFFGVHEFRSAAEASRASRHPEPDYPASERRLSYNQVFLSNRANGNLRISIEWCELDPEQWAQLTITKAELDPLTSCKGTFIYPSVQVILGHGMTATQVPAKANMFRDGTTTTFRFRRLIAPSAGTQTPGYFIRVEVNMHVAAAAGSKLKDNS